jgi:hypothetical protein
MNKKLDNIEYTDILNNVNKSKPKSNKIGTIANRIIKKKFIERNNYNKLVAIKIKGNKFNNEIWIRNTEEVNQTGRRCNNAFNKEELRIMLKNIWNSIIEANRQNEIITDNIISFEDFIKNNQEQYKKFFTGKFKKEKICPFIEKLFKYANDKKINKKLWYQLLNDS